jgi:hypothetical protein
MCPGCRKRQFIILSVLAAVTDRRRNSLVKYKVGLRWNFESLQMGPNMLYRINYCHLQACVEASRVRYKLKKELSRWYKVKGHKKSSLRSEGRFAAKILQTLLVKNLDANEPRVCHGPAANLSRCKRADDSENVIAA